jgi:hypothetical protein
MACTEQLYFLLSGRRVMELAAGLNSHVTDRTGRPTVLSAETEGALVERILYLQQRGVGLTDI